MKGNQYIRNGFLFIFIFAIICIMFFFINRFFIDYKVARLLDSDNGFGDYKCQLSDNLFINRNNEVIEWEDSNIEGVLLTEADSVFSSSNDFVFKTHYNKIVKNNIIF